MKIKGGRKLARSKNRGTKYVAQRARTTRNKLRAAARHAVLYKPTFVATMNEAHRQSKLQRRARQVARRLAELPGVISSLQSQIEWHKKEGDAPQGALENLQSRLKTAELDFRRFQTRASELPKPVGVKILPFKRSFVFVIRPIWTIYNTNPRNLLNHSAVAARAYFARTECV